MLCVCDKIAAEMVRARVLPQVAVEVQTIGVIGIRRETKRETGFIFGAKN